MMGGEQAFTLQSDVLGALPLINHFLSRLQVSQLLERFVPHDDARLALAPAAVFGVLVRNLVIHKEPVYALSEWVSRYDPAVLGIGSDDIGMINDDRIGRMLERLFDADRASLLTALTLGAINEFAIDCSQLHNDSTSITLSGIYQSGDGRARGGRPTAAITWGHNKDHRPDLKQLLWILTVSKDGAVPIAYRVADGNTADDVTHIPTWDGLVTLTGETSFLYVADKKLCSSEAMGYIASHGGRFLTVLPRSRKEDSFFRAWVQDHTPAWEEVARHPGKRIGDPEQVWRAVPSPIPSAEDYRIVWVWSSAKARQDHASRQGRIEAGIKALEELAGRVSGPKSRFHSRVAVEEAAAAKLSGGGAERWVGFEVTETIEDSFRQERRGRPGAKTRYRKTTCARFSITWKVSGDAVAYDARSDGCFPLITNDEAMTPAELLAAYKYQPNLEKRHAQLKGTQLVGEMFLKSPARIEGLLFCHFIALLTQALIEREIRAAMAAEQRKSLMLYPEDRACAAPTAARVVEIFSDVARHSLLQGGRLVQVFEPTLTPLQLEVLGLLGIAPSAYSAAAA